MKRTKLLKENPPQEPPKRTSKDVIAKSQLLTVDGKETLNIDLFYQEICRARYFADQQEHYCYIDGKWKRCKMHNAALLCKGKQIETDYCCYKEEWEWESENDKKTAIDYLRAYSVESYENQIAWQKKIKAEERKSERINKAMEWIPVVPEQAEKWILDEIFPGDIIFISKQENRTIYHCTACEKSGWKKHGWKHGKQTSCPKCGKPVKTNSIQTERMAKAPVVILQAGKGKWVERQFMAECIWSKSGKELSLYEQCRALIPEGKCWGKAFYGTYRKADEFGQEYWDTNPENKRFMESYLYPGNLEEVLPYGNLERSGLDRIAKEKIKVNVNKFITSYHDKTYIEFLNKAGLTKLAADIMNQYGWYGNPSKLRVSENKLKDVLRLDGNRTSRMKQLNGNLITLEWLQYEQKAEVKITQDSLAYLTTKKVHVDDCKGILNELKSVNRMVNYMKKQKTAPTRLTILWNDYLRMAAEEGMDTSDDIIRLPRDVKARHDELVAIRNQRRDAERMKKDKAKYAVIDEKIKKHLPEAAKFFWEDEKYMIIPAGKCSELVKEGSTLHHCVGASDQYMEKMADGKTWICFLRKKKDMEKPYYTLEIDMNDGRIIQWYSEYDRKPDKEEISKVLDRFKQQVKRKMVRGMAKTA